MNPEPALTKTLTMFTKAIPDPIQEPKLRKITEHQDWNLAWKELSIEESNAVMQTIPEEYFPESQNKTLDMQRQILMHSLRQKQLGYKNQDIVKGLYNPHLFVSFADIVRKLKASEMLCFYCRKQFKLFYDNVRDAKQWSLERIENNQGHNSSNVVIACLSCNLKRRTMFHEKYRFTKQLIVQKLN